MTGTGGSVPKKKHLVLVGAGHAHLYGLARLEMLVGKSEKLTVISTSPFWYSGMGPGLLSEQYRSDDASVDVRSMVEDRGGRFIEGIVTAVKADDHYVETGSGEKIPYDVMSLNIGSEVSGIPVDRAESPMFKVKPVSLFLDMRDRILGLGSGREIRIIIVGGGPSGCETAANALALCRNHGLKCSVRLLAGKGGLIQNFPAEARSFMENWFRKNGVSVQTGRLVSGVEGNTVVFDDDSREECDIVIAALGVHPPKLIDHSGISADESGAMRVDRHLQSVSHPGVFGGGDCIRFEPYPLARVGVYAVRQGPVLFDNILASLSGGQLREFKPQKQFIQILNLGDGNGLLVRGKFVMSSRFAFLFKKWLDLSFMGQYKSAEDGRK